MVSSVLVRAGHRRLSPRLHALLCPALPLRRLLLLLFLLLFLFLFLSLDLPWHAEDN